MSVSTLMELWPQCLSISATYLGLFALMCLRVGPPGSPTSTAVPKRETSSADWVLILVLAALPAIGWLFANLVTGLLLFRYVIAAVIGFSLGVALLCRVAVARRPETRAVARGVGRDHGGREHDGRPTYPADDDGHNGAYRSRAGMFSNDETLGTAASGWSADRRE